MNKPKPEIIKAFVLLCSLLITGCSDSGGSSESNDVEDSTITGTGRFIDGPVSGLYYKSGALEGFTNAKGEFRYIVGESTQFSYEGITIGEAKVKFVNGRPFVTPRSFITGGEHESTLVNILRFLQTLDTNNNHDDGISLADIDDAIVLPEINFNQSSESFEGDSNLQNVLAAVINKVALISSSEALNNFESASESVGLNVDEDEDGTPDLYDAFPEDSAEQKDTDEDGVGNNEDTDDDNDEVPDADDEFPLDATESVDTDGDGVGNHVDTDDDNDEVSDVNDAFPLDATEYVDTDDDGTGNNADTDDDNDGLSDEDEAEFGTDPLLVDTDSDGVNDDTDEFKLDATESVDTDGDGTGNNADTDDDNDGVLDEDEAELGSNPLLVDGDNDGIDDSNDNCPAASNPSQTNTDNDLQGDACDRDDDNDGLSDLEERLLGSDPLLADSDNDGVLDIVDDCPVNSNPPVDPNGEQLNTDGDLQGDACDHDDDNDRVLDIDDNCPIDANNDQLDTDEDEQGDVCDNDDDEDGLTDIKEGDLGTDPLLIDTDSDGLTDFEELDLGTDPLLDDTDSDGYIDSVDNCPINTNADQLDTDGDTQGDVCDEDDDNDGLTDTQEGELATDPLLTDTDSDGLTDFEEVNLTTDPLFSDTDGDDLTDFEEANLGTSPLLADTDSDGAIDSVDNCPVNANADQLNTDVDDGDTQGNVCDEDDDNDGLTDLEELELGTEPLLTDTDSDGLTDLEEVNLGTDPLLADTDSDGLTDLEEVNLGITNPLLADTDSDGAIDSVDNCPIDPNDDQANADGDANGNVCDEDDDNDGLTDNEDNCPVNANADQVDTDGDTQGNACDEDDDNDGRTDLEENNVGSDQLLVDSDNDGLTDLEEFNLGTNPLSEDHDDDGFFDNVDNCPVNANADQLDTDEDLQGDACDTDDDNDGLTDFEEADLGTDPLLADTDKDGLTDFEEVSLGITDPMLDDTDIDGALDGVDNCPIEANADQLNTDGDTQGNACDEDDDNDGLTDLEELDLGSNPLLVNSDNDEFFDDVDNCPSVDNADQLNTDGDAQGDACDDDDDNDGLNDPEEATFGSNPLLVDTDSDGLTDSEEAGLKTDPQLADTDEDGLTDFEEVTLGSKPLLPDTDSDGVLDGVDNCPKETNADQLNTDGDTQGNVCDEDDDNDGLTDAQEAGLGTNPLLVDTDIDGLTDFEEVNSATDELLPDTDNDGDIDGVDNCPIEANADQLNTDGDTQGNVCDDDDDNDGLTDLEELGLGSDPLLVNSDNDEFFDDVDNCPSVDNADQLNTDGDTQGDACDEDDDNDGLKDPAEETLGSNPLLVDTDSDGRTDLEEFNSGTDLLKTDTDDDGLTDLEEFNLGTSPLLTDSDNDGHLDNVDNCPISVNADQLDTDTDKQGNVCDEDDDNDGLTDTQEGGLGTNPLLADTDGDGLTDLEEVNLGTNPLLADSDTDGLTDLEEVNLATDPLSDDTDNDGAIDGVDNCPVNPNADQIDTDNDEQGNVCDEDDDNDGLTDLEEVGLGTNPLLADTDSDGSIDSLDNCLFSANADQLDTDADEQGNVCDEDNDNDGLTDFEEVNLGTDPLSEDTDSDGENDNVDNCPLITNADQLDADGDTFGDVCDDDLVFSLFSATNTSNPKEISFSWAGNDLAVADHFTLFVNPDGLSGFTEVAGSNAIAGTARNHEIEIAVHLTDWVNAQYRLEAQASDNSIISSAELSIVNELSSIDHTGYFKASNTGAGDVFASSVTISGDGLTLAVGAPMEDSSARGEGGDQINNDVLNSGAVYVFTKIGSVWAQQAYIKASNTDLNDNFGGSVQLSDDGNTLVVGASGEDSDSVGINGPQGDNEAVASSSGAVYVWVRSGASWTQQAYLKASNTGRSDEFGDALALSSDGNTLVVGANGEASSATGINGDQISNLSGNSGAAYVFVRSGSTWSQQAYIKASNTSPGDQFGVSLAVSNDGNTLAVGAILEDSAATGIDGLQSNDDMTMSGAVYVFTRSGSDWSQEAYVKSSNSGVQDFFGESLEMSGDGDTLVVGANGEASGSVGINADETDDGSSRSGATYVFTRSGSSWSQQAYIKASNAQTGDEFGVSLSLSDDGDKLVVGAKLEDSLSSGINGDDDSGASDSGAAYVFIRELGAWSQLSFVKSSNSRSLDQLGTCTAMSSDGETLAVCASRQKGSEVGVNSELSAEFINDTGAVYLY